MTAADGRRGLGAALLALALVLTASAATSADTDPARALHAALGPRIALGWNTVTPELVDAAARRGATLAVLYGPAPDPGSALGQAMTRSGMRVVSAELSLRVADLECTRTRTVAPPPQGAEAFCAAGTDYDVADLLDDTRDVAARDAANPLVVGHWILDDVAGWDEGGLRSALEQVKTRLPAGQPTICGFSANLGGTGVAPWDARRAANFSPAACDAVAPYVYAVPVPPGGSRPVVDWSMGSVLPAVLGSLRDAGWAQDRTPLLGVGQAWGGTHAGDRARQYPPTADEMVTQAEAFRAARALGLGWYAWSLSDYPDARTPAVDPALADGVQRAVRTLGP